MTKVISYIRASTSFQDLENQKLEISKCTAKLGLEVTEWIAVEMSSRKTTGDRRINELLDSLHKGDVLVVSELSRLARSMREIHNITHTLEQKGVCLHVVKQGIVVDGNKDIATKILINTFVCRNPFSAHHPPSPLRCDRPALPTGSPCLFGPTRYDAPIGTHDKE